LSQLKNPRLQINFKYKKLQRYFPATMHDIATKFGTMMLEPNLNMSREDLDFLNIEDGGRLLSKK